MSGGERQRLGLARLELLQTPYVILDESFANLDIQTVKELLKLLTGAPERTVIVIAHQLPQEVEMMFDAVVEIQERQLVRVSGRGNTSDARC